MTRQSQDIDRIVGLRMAERRQALGMTQQGLADQLGVSFQQVQKYEKGANRVSASRLHALSEALSCTVSDFFPDQYDRESGGKGRLMSLLATRDGRALAESYLAIADLEVRQALGRVALALAKA